MIGERSPQRNLSSNYNGRYKQAGFVLVASLSVLLLSTVLAFAIRQKSTLMHKATIAKQDEIRASDAAMGAILSIARQITDVDVTTNPESDDMPGNLSPLSNDNDADFSENVTNLMRGDIAAWEAMSTTSITTDAGAISDVRYFILRDGFQHSGDVNENDAYGHYLYKIVAMGQGRIPGTRVIVNRTVRKKFSDF